MLLWMWVLTPAGCFHLFSFFVGFLMGTITTRFVFLPVGICVLLLVFFLLEVVWKASNMPNREADGMWGGIWHQAKCGMGMVETHVCDIIYIYIYILYILCLYTL